MIGPNRPTADFYVVGQPQTNDLKDPKVWTTWRTFVAQNRTHGNMTATADKRAVIIYVENGAVKIAFAPSVPGVLNGTESFDTENAIILAEGLIGAQASIDLIDGKLNICITHVLTQLCAEFWRDTDGNGTDINKVSDIATDLSSGYAYPPDAGLAPSMIHRLGSGALVVMVPWLSWIYSTMRCCYSLNNGESWNLGAIIGVGLGSHGGEGCSKSFLIMSDTSFVVSNLVSSGAAWMLHYTNNGAFNSEIGFNTDWGDPLRPWMVSFITVNDNNYMCHWGGSGIVIRKLKQPPTINNLSSINDWEFVTTFPGDAPTDMVRHHFTLTSEGLILQHSIYNLISGAGTNFLKVKIPIKSIVVNRSKGTASRAMVVIDNTLGMYSPDSIGRWAKVLWFNKKVIIRAGYGSNPQLIFTGLIDAIYVSNYPAELTVSSRDFSKLALDQNPQDDFSGGEVAYAFTYYNKTPEYIFKDLAIQAGWLLETIHVEDTGITLEEFPVGHEAIADCFQRLCEITGFEWLADEIGDIYFRRARDPEAVKVYTFTEGVDIFSLNYTLDDEELYRNIVVYSNNSNRDTIKTTVLWPGADYNNVLPKKTLIVNAGDLVIDQASCDAIAQNESNAITPKVREVNFVAVGNPYVQIGDVIQVIETSSHASEYYRILDITHRINPTGKPVYATELRCYHFSYGE